MVLHVDSERLRADFETLAQFGATPAGGVERTTFSGAHLSARAWFLELARVAGLETRVDSAANHSALLRAGRPGARTLLLGSHLDSVRQGGRYDGALGVLCALEVLRAVKDAGLELPVTLEAIDFTDEEGTLVGTLGSEALAGELIARSARGSTRWARAASVAELGRMGLTEEGMLAAHRDPATLVGYLELHIEQGPVLERAGADIGIVTGITGASSFLVVFEGDARHAGTTPMDARRDAALGAAAFTLGVRETVTHDFPGCVATVGDIALSPGSYNVVPGRARVRLDCRSLDAAELDALEQALEPFVPTRRPRRSGSTSRSSASSARSRSITDVGVRTACATRCRRPRADNAGVTLRRRPRCAWRSRGSHRAGWCSFPRRAASATTRPSSPPGTTASTAPTCCSAPRSSWRTPRLTGLRG